MESSISSSSTASGDHHAGLSALNVFECHICMEPPTSPVATPCGHVFCSLCIQPWLGENEVKACPVCRHLIKASVRILALHGLDDDGGGATSTSVAPQRPHNPSLFLPRQFKGGITIRLEIDPHNCTQDSMAVSLAYNEFFRLKAERLSYVWNLSTLDIERQNYYLLTDEGQELDESILELQRQLSLARGNVPNDESPMDQ